MKIMLLGDFSSVHLNLKEGLKSLGHEVYIASNGDGYRDIERDIDWAPRKNPKFKSLIISYKILKSMFKIKGYDIVQLMSPVQFPLRFILLNKIFIYYIKKHNHKIFLLGAGSLDHNTIIANFYKNQHKYPQIYSNFIRLKKMNDWSLTKSGKEYNKYLNDRIDGFIPLMYEYAQGYRDLFFEKLCKTIPMPINTDKIQFIEHSLYSKEKSKIKIFHGITRPSLKGSEIIIKAMENVKLQYSDEVEIFIVNNLNISDYLNVIKDANIVIEQTYAISYGMTAIYNLAMGKIVFSGAQKECLEEFNVDDCPIVSITPNLSEIEDKIIFFIKNKDMISQISYKSRQYVEKIHNYIKVAQHFVDTWT